MSDDGEMERTNVYLPVTEKQVVQQRSAISVSEACRRTGLVPAARGAEVIEAAVRQEDADEQWARTQDGILSVLAYLDNIAGDGGAVTIETVHEEFEAFCTERDAEIAEQFEEPVSEAMDEYEQEQAEKFESLVSTVEEFLHDGEHVWPGRGKVEELAKLRGETPENIVEFLKERNPDIPDRQFEKKSRSTRRPRRSL